MILYLILTGLGNSRVVAAVCDCCFSIEIWDLLDGLRQAELKRHPVNFLLEGWKEKRRLDGVTV